MSITILETRDLFAKNFGLQSLEWDFIEGATIEVYCSKYYTDVDPYILQISANGEVVGFNYVVEKTDIILVGVGVGEGFTWAGVISAIGKFATWAGGKTLGAFLFQAAAMTAFSMLVNMLLAPDTPSIDDASSQDSSKAYQWGGLSNTSDQMIPINVTLGEMLVAGNLVGVRTESRNVHTAGYSIRDTAYFLYGLTSNTLSSIEEVYINDIPISEFDKDDISVYYTLGTADQEPINSLLSLSMLTDDTPAPASDGILFPSLTTETVVNQELESPDHLVSLTESGSVLVGYQASEEFISTIPFMTLNANLASTETTSFVVQYDTEVFGDLNTTILALSTPVYLRLALTELSYDYTDNHELVLISNIAHHSTSGTDELFTVTISERLLPKAWATGATTIGYLVATPIYKTTYTIDAAGTDIWNANAYVPSDSWTIKMSTSSEIEDVELEFTHPQGLYFVYGGTHSGKSAGAKYSRWETYDYHLKQYDSTGTTVVADTLFTSPDDGQTTSYLEAMFANTQDMPRGFFSMGTYTSARSWSLKFTDIIRAKATYPSRYSTNSTHIALDSNGYLPKGYRYEISTRIHGHGNSNRDGVLGYYTFDPQGAVETNETDVYGTVLYRFKELNYDEVLSYPYTSLLAVAANATPTMNNSMPKVTAKVRAEILVGSEATKNTPSAWTAQFSQNNAWIALTALYNGVWGGNVGAGVDADFAANIDMDSWLLFATHCDSVIMSGALTGEANYTFNGTFDTKTTLLEAVNVIVSAANGVIVFNGSRLGVYFEQDTTMTQVFSPGNIVEDSMSIEYLNTVDTADAISGNFIDSTNNYEKTTMSYNYPDGDPRKSTSVELIGVVEPDRVIRSLLYKLNKTNGIKVMYSLKALSSAIRATKGDVIGLENEFIEYGVGGGRLQSINESTGVITLDRIYEEVTGTKYLTVAAQDGTLYPSVTTNWAITNWDNTGDTTLVTVGNTIELENIDALDVFLIGIGSDICRKALVNTIDINNDFTSTITAYGYIPFSEFDTGAFVLSTTQLQGITKEAFCPRNITFTADNKLTSVRVTWDPPSIASSTKDDGNFTIYRYALWRRQGTNEQWNHIADIAGGVGLYVDEPALGSVYYYKVVPIFNYFGTEATIPMSWVENFTDSGNADVEAGVDFTFSVYEYLPKPILSTVTDSNGYKVTINSTNSSLRDLTVFVTDPDDWMYQDKREGFGVWLRASNSSSTDWLGPQSITLSTGVSAGDSSITVSSTTGLCIPGLVVINDIDLVYVSAIASGTTLTVPYTAESRKFSIDLDHSAGVSVRNAHLGLNPIKYYAFESDVDVICATRQIRSSTVYKYNQLTNSVSSSDWGDMVSVGLEKYRIVQGISNHVLYIESATKYTVTTRYDIPEVADFIITSSHHDAFGYPISVYAIMWQWENSTLKLNDNDEIYFTLNSLPPFDYVWFGLTRMQFPVNIDDIPLYGWTSQVSIEGV